MHLSINLSRLCTQPPPFLLPCSVSSPFHLIPDMPNCSQLAFFSLSFPPSLLIYSSLPSYPLFSALPICCANQMEGVKTDFVPFKIIVSFPAPSCSMNKADGNETVIELVCPHLSHLTPSGYLFCPFTFHRPPSPRLFFLFTVTLTLSLVCSTFITCDPVPALFAVFPHSAPPSGWKKGMISENTFRFSFHACCQ